MADEHKQIRAEWFPRCPKCGKGSPMLAPSTEATHFALAFVEVYCAECQWQGRLDQFIRKIYVRL
jgi:hypothetical protein